MPKASIIKQFKKLLTLAALVSMSYIPLPAYAADAEGNYAVWGVGSRSCFKYSKAREADAFDDYTNYIKGFITAFNMLTEDTYSITGNKNFNDLLTWLDDYCGEQQINALEQGLLELVAATEEDRLKKPRKNSGR